MAPLQPKSFAPGGTLPSPASHREPVLALRIGGAGPTKRNWMRWHGTSLKARLRDFRNSAIHNGWRRTLLLRPFGSAREHTGWDFGAIRFNFDAGTGVSQYLFEDTIFDEQIDEQILYMGGVDERVLFYVTHGDLSGLRKYVDYCLEPIAAFPKVSIAVDALAAGETDSVLAQTLSAWAQDNGGRHRLLGEPIPYASSPLMVAHRSVCIADFGQLYKAGSARVIHPQHAAERIVWCSGRADVDLDNDGDPDIKAWHLLRQDPEYARAWCRNLGRKDYTPCFDEGVALTRDEVVQAWKEGQS
jgi:hypothetical protein